MRGVAKKGPPQGDVSASAEPITWIEARKRLAKDVDALSSDSVRKEHFDTLSKPKMRARLLEEQRYRCAFCERELKEDDANGGSDVRIAHWTPIKQDKTRALEWDNLYASCSAKETCDSRQRSDLLGLRTPAELDFENVLDFRPNGEVHISASLGGRLREGEREALQRALGDPVIASLDPKRGDHRSPLNINHKSLQVARAAALKGLQREIARKYPGSTARPEHLRKLLTRLLEGAPRTAFVSVQVTWLERRLSRT